MAQEDMQGRRGLSRRDFLKVSAAGAVAATALDWAPAPAMASIKTDGGETTTNYVSTCPYCSAQCGQVVTVGNTTGKVYDIFGDVDSPTNNGGLCAKGAGSLQLVNNPYRIGAFAGVHPEDGNKLAPTTGWGYDSSYTDGIAYKRTGNGAYQKMALSTAMGEIATALVAARNNGDTSANIAGLSDVAPWAGTPGQNSRAVQFFGSSHINNEQNYLYRKIVANFGTSRVEHQARI